MPDTNQLPEPDLGYIKTDISNQPAFSARQMREAMTHTNKLPPLPTPKFTETIRGVPCITVTEHEHLMRAYALQARAQVQGDPSWWTRETDEGAEWTDTAPLVLSGWTPLYTTPQAGQATRAEVTDGIQPEDFTVDVVVKPMGGFAPVNTQGVRVTHKPTGISVTCDAARSQHTNRHQAFEKLRAILALRPERAPMTDEQREYFLDGYESAQRDAIACRIPPTGFTFVAVRIDDEALVKRGMDRLREAHHDITAQATKETP